MEEASISNAIDIKSLQDKVLLLESRLSTESELRKIAESKAADIDAKFLQRYYSISSFKYELQFQFHFLQSVKE